MFIKTIELASYISLALITVENNELRSVQK